VSASVVGTYNKEGQGFRRPDVRSGDAAPRPGAAPRPAIRRGQLRAFSCGALQHNDPVAQSQVLQRKHRARTDHGRQSAKECRKNNEHRRRIRIDSIIPIRSDTSRFSRGTGDLRSSARYGTAQNISFGLAATVGATKNWRERRDSNAASSAVTASDVFLCRTSPSQRPLGEHRIYVLASGRAVHLLDPNHRSRSVISGRALRLGRAPTADVDARSTSV
jgi:hypothetical protein